MLALASFRKLSTQHFALSSSQYIIGAKQFVVVFPPCVCSAICCLSRSRRRWMEVVSIYCRVSASGSISQSGNFSGPRKVEISQGRAEWPWTNLSGHLPSVPINSQSLGAVHILRQPKSGVRGPPLPPPSAIVSIWLTPSPPRQLLSAFARHPFCDPHTPSSAMVSFLLTPLPPPAADVTCERPLILLLQIRPKSAPAPPNPRASK